MAFAILLHRNEDGVDFARREDFQPQRVAQRVLHRIGAQQQPGRGRQAHAARGGHLGVSDIHGVDCEARRARCARDHVCRQRDCSQPGGVGGGGDRLGEHIALNGESGLRRRAVGVAHIHIEQVVGPRNQPRARLGGEIHQQRVFGYGDLFLNALEMLRSVSHLHLQVEGGRAHGCLTFTRQCDKGLGHGEGKGVDAARVGLARHGHGLHALYIGHIALQTDRAACHWLAKEVGCCDRAGDHFTRQIPRSLRVELHLEARQRVGLDLHRGAHAEGALARLKRVVARQRLHAQRQIGRGNAETGTFYGLVEDAIACGVRHCEGNLLVGGGLHGGTVERQPAHVQHLSRLIDGLVGGEEHVIDIGNDDGALGEEAARARIQLDGEARGRIHEGIDVCHGVGHVEDDLCRAACVCAAPVKQFGFETGLLQRDLDGAIGTRLSLDAVGQHGQELRLAAGREVAAEAEGGDRLHGRGRRRAAQQQEDRRQQKAKQEVGAARHGDSFVHRCVQRGSAWMIGVVYGEAQGSTLHT